MHDSRLCSQDQEELYSSDSDSDEDENTRQEKVTPIHQFSVVDKN